MNTLKKAGNWLAPPANKSEDGRDQWPSRTSFILAAMGGCAGMGNLLRYPSQVYNNHGLQWFVPYLMAVFIIAIPVLVLEIAIGQAYRGGSVIAYNNVNHRLRGLGLGLLFVAFFVGHYFVVNLAWIMDYFRNSFTSPLPWTGRGEEFYYQDVVANVDPIVGSLSEDGSSVLSYTSYPGIGLVGETVGWTAFTWFLVWLCIFKGVGLTGRVVYFTLGLPIVITIILVGRACSLENAGEGVGLVWATWRSSELARGQIWQTACGQVFFSTGVGFGYFTSYASYNQKYSNAVMDSILIVCSNVLFENFAAFAVFGVVGYLRLFPQDGVRLGSFTVGFLTLPLAVTEMPGANFWAFALFFTLMVLGFSSAFAQLDAIVTMWMDSGTKLSRPVVVTILVMISFLLSLPYCTQFGYYLLEGIDRWINDVALIFVVWAECVCSTTVYRWKDVTNQVGLLAFTIYNIGYFGGMIFGVAVAHAVSPPAGAGLGFGLYVAGAVASVTLSQTPSSGAARFWARNTYASRFWYLAFYSGNQLRRDLNLIVGTGKNWTIPSFWPLLMRYISAPILAIIFSFAYPSFYLLRYDPLHILGFTLAHVCLLVIGLGVILPRWFDVFLPPHRLNDGKVDTIPNVNQSAIDAEQKALEEGGDTTGPGKDEPIK
ncbi:hypothetical protein LTR64_003735 [Lithohypha guttulata]|uniref:uncharacterized protein n=1 Tax=Lithohypha guttulata TaxID=1690604 RepID=UPI002DE0BEED|nr:hypothetical protein LTR51_000045 [Lithohypha guttulata]